MGWLDTVKENVSTETDDLTQTPSLVLGDPPDELTGGVGGIDQDTELNEDGYTVGDAYDDAPTREESIRSIDDAAITVASETREYVTPDLPWWVKPTAFVSVFLVVTSAVSYAIGQLFTFNFGGN